MKPIFLVLMLFGMAANAQSIQPDKVLKSFLDQAKCLQIKNDNVGIIIKVDCYEECEKLYALLQTYPEFYRILLPEGEKPEYKYFHFKDFNGHDGIAQFYFENGVSSVTLLYIQSQSDLGGNESRKEALKLGFIYTEVNIVSQVNLLWV